MTAFDDYASYLDEDYHQDQQEMEEKYRDGTIKIDCDDDDYNDPRETIKREVAI